MSSTLTIGEALAVTTYKQSLSFTTYRLLATWLDCYTYILPDQRVLRESALYIPPASRLRTSYINLWEFITLLEIHYTDQEQSNIIREIQCQLISSPPPSDQQHLHKMTQTI